MVRIDKRRCDRCEQEYTTQPNVLPNTTIVPAMYVVVKHNVFGTSVKLELKDMCDDCLKRLQNWWDRIGEEDGR